MNSSPGMCLLRRLTHAERELLESVHREYADSLHMPAGIIHWLNLFLNGRPRLRHSLETPLHRWVLETVAEAYADWPKRFVLSYGLLVNPAGNTSYQPFHCDYSRTSSNLFVPLTRVTLLNATQYIRRSLPRTPVDPLLAVGSLDDILDAEECGAIEVAQWVCRPFVLLRLNANTPHRGTPNLEAYDRVTFWITVDDHDHDLAETVHVKYSESEYSEA